MEPHVSSVPVSALVITVADGYLLLSSSDRSQGMASICEQSPPVGQHSAVVLPARAMQVDVDGQQKSEGRSTAHWT